MVSVNIVAPQVNNCRRITETVQRLKNGSFHFFLTLILFVSNVLPVALGSLRVVMESYMAERECLQG